MKEFSIKSLKALKIMCDSSYKIVTFVRQKNSFFPDDLKCIFLHRRDFHLNYDQMRFKYFLELTFSFLGVSCFWQRNVDCTHAAREMLVWDPCTKHKHHNKVGLFHIVLCLLWPNGTVCFLSSPNIRRNEFITYCVLLKIGLHNLHQNQSTNLPI